MCVVSFCVLMYLRPAVGKERSQAWSVMTETSPGQIEDPPIQLPSSSFYLFISSSFLSPSLVLEPRFSRCWWWESRLLLKWLAASALWIRGGCRQDYKQQVMSSEHVRPAPILEGYVNVFVDKTCFSALSTFPFLFLPVEMQGSLV